MLACVIGGTVSAILLIELSAIPFLFAAAVLIAFSAFIVTTL